MASDAELAWLRRLGAWDSRLLAGLRKAGRIESSPDLVRKLLRHDGQTTMTHSQALEVADTCSADPTSAVGPPPTDRLRPALATSARSRIEPRFGEVASRLAGQEVEVRCWSRPDWVRLLREEKAYTKHRIDEDTLGFAGIEGSRVNLAPDVCDGLVDLA